MTLGILLGLAMAMLRAFRFRLLNGLIVAFVDVFRTLPQLVVMVFAYFGLPYAGITISAFAAAVLGLALVLAAFAEEAFWAAITAIPRGQWEAARSTGLSFGQALASVVMPQAVRIAIPLLTNRTIAITKGTALASVISVPEILDKAQSAMSISANASPLIVGLGLFVAVLYSFHLRFLNPLLIIWVDALRAFPVLVLLVLVFYGLPFVGINLPQFAAAVLALALNSGGYYGEIFRAGIEAVPRGQTEAARSTGLSAWQAAFSVVLPQAVRHVLAPLAGNTLELIKTTSIATAVALPELLRSARVAQETTYNPTPLTAAALIYFLLLWPLTRLVARLERKMVASR